MKLHEKLTAYEADGMLPIEVPSYVTANLAPAITLRPYQEQAVSRFVWQETRERHDPLHLLFHMATGSGKTVVMAAALLHLWTKGYRDVLFFVNSSQIVGKTRANFVDPTSPKHLFASPVRIGDETVLIRAVNTFSEASDDALNIVFTTIQGLHTTLRDPKENGVTFEDFEDRKVVLISDEAHHINALTKKRLTEGEKEEENSWEHTVERLRKADPRNVLLEFSATIDMAHPAIAAKYADKILIDYDLRRFRADRYSKDIELRRADLGVEDRMLHAIVISEHRRRVAADLLGADWKPVVMMKSGTIAASAENEAAFAAMIDALDGPRLAALHAAARDGSDTVLAGALDALAAGNRHDDLALVLRTEFGEARRTNVNKPDDLGAQQILLNTLEAPGNPIRCIFAVDKLDEGWDVLNLFDIVRLTDKAGTGKKPSSTTMREAQLIGRGARYYPFADPDDAEVEPDRRKYDDDHGAPKRLLEQMLYHCTSDVKYIQDLRTALIQTGALEEGEATVELKVKDTFRKTDVFQNYSFWANRSERIDKTKRKVNDILSTRAFSVTLPAIPHSDVEHMSAFDVPTEASPNDDVPGSRTLALHELPYPALRRASDEIRRLRFDHLRDAMPRLPSLRTFLTEKDHAGGVTITVHGPKSRLNPLLPSDALLIAKDVLSKIVGDVEAARAPYAGSTRFHPLRIAERLKDRTLKLTVPGETMLSWTASHVAGTGSVDLANVDWHVFDDCYGTAEEKAFVVFIAEHQEEIGSVFPEFYLIRNDKAVKLHEIGGARATEPDYIRILRRSNGDALCRQVFIEPKGDRGWNEEQWKSNFLAAICFDHENGGDILAPEPHEIRGLPFYGAEAARSQSFAAHFRSKVIPSLATPEGDTA